MDVTITAPVAKAAIMPKPKKMKKPAPASECITCTMCEHQIATTGTTCTGDTEPYMAKSLITHYKQTHGTNSLGIDQALGLEPGTTPKCSPTLKAVFKKAGESGAAEMAKKMEHMAELEAKAIKAGL